MVDAYEAVCTVFDQRDVCYAEGSTSSKVCLTCVSATASVVSGQVESRTRASAHPIQLSENYMLHCVIPQRAWRSARK